MQELHQLRSARAETCPGKDWVSTGSGTTRRQQKTPSLHTCLPCDHNSWAYLEEVQPATSDTTWENLRKRRITNCVSDLGQVTLKGNVQTEDQLKVQKYNGGLSSSWVGARRSSGRSPASSWVGRPAGGARTLAPVFGRSLHSQELEDDLYRTKSLASYATQLRRQRQALS